MQFDRNLVSESLRVSSLALPYMVLAVLSEFVFQIAIEVTLPGMFELADDAQVTRMQLAYYAAYLLAATLVWALLAYVAHAQTLATHVTVGRKSVSRIAGFAFRSILLFWLVLVLAITSSMLHFHSTEQDGESGNMLLSLELALSVFTALVLAAFGTWLPAYVAGKDAKLRLAVSRGWRQFGYAFTRLLAGPGAMTMGVLAVDYAVIPSSGQDGRILTESGWLDLWNTISLLFFNLSLAVSTVLTAVILSRAYLRDQAALPSTADNRP